MSDRVSRHDDLYPDLAMWAARAAVAEGQLTAIRAAFLAPDRNEWKTLRRIREIVGPIDYCHEGEPLQVPEHEEHR